MKTVVLLFVAATSFVYYRKQQGRALSVQNSSTDDQLANDENDEVVVPIGFVRSVFTNKRGVPRQGLLAPGTKARVELSKEIVSFDALTGLEQFSHVWIVFLFSRNSNANSLENWRSKKHNLFKSKVRPPLLGGKKVGIFATRSPHRPNPIGMSLVKVHSVDIDNGHIYVDGVDLCDMTPVIDLKPYVPADRPADEKISFAEWVVKTTKYKVECTSEVESILSKHETRGKMFYKSGEELREAIKDVLELDVRGVSQDRGSANPNLVHHTTVDGVRVGFSYMDNGIVKVHELVLC